MLRKNRLLISAAAVFFVLSGANLLYAGINMSGVHAYPVPFNPKKSGASKAIALKGFSCLDCSVKMEVFDINGDKVVSRTFNIASYEIKNAWNARNVSGKLVSPGMYIIKLSVENSSDGDFGQKIIRVLIAY